MRRARCKNRRYGAAFIREDIMSTLWLLLIVLLVIGALPSWPYSRSWGYYPSGLLSIVLIVMIILLIRGG